MDAYIVSAVRTPIGKFGGVFKDISPVDLGASAIREALRRVSIPPDRVDISIMGNVIRGGHGQDLAHQAAVKAGIPVEVDGYCVDMVCSSGMMSLVNAAQLVRTGDASIVVAGGMESMSQSGLSLPHEVRWGPKMLLGKSLSFSDMMLVDGLIDPFNAKLMGQEADMVARDRGISRKELDEVALLSFKRAVEATDKGYFKHEIVPMSVGSKVVESDEGIRRDTTIEKLSSLPPAFSKDGFHTAGNSSQISDGASAMVIMNEKSMKEYGLEPIAKILGYSWVGIESWRFTEAPIHAIKKLLDKLGMDISKVDFFENNEAFAVNNALVNKYLGIPYDKLNVFGGAIALGHPIGASGTRVTTTLLNVLSRRGGKYGIASLCHGTGGATALAVELIKPM